MDATIGKKIPKLTAGGGIIGEKEAISAAIMEEEMLSVIRSDIVLSIVDYDSAVAKILKSIRKDPKRISDVMGYLLHNDEA